MSEGMGVLRKVSNCSNLATLTASKVGNASSVAVSSVVSLEYLLSNSITTDNPFRSTLLLPERTYLCVNQGLIFVTIRERRKKGKSGPRKEKGIREKLVNKSFTLELV